MRIDEVSERVGQVRRLCVGVAGEEDVDATPPHFRSSMPPSRLHPKDVASCPTHERPNESVTDNRADNCPSNRRTMETGKKGRGRTDLHPPAKTADEERTDEKTTTTTTTLLQKKKTSTLRVCYGGSCREEKGNGRSHAVLPPTLRPISGKWNTTTKKKKKRVVVVWCLQEMAMNCGEGRRLAFCYVLAFVCHAAPVVVHTPPLPPPLRFPLFFSFFFLLLRVQKRRWWWWKKKKTTKECRSKTRLTETTGWEKMVFAAAPRVWRKATRRSPSRPLLFFRFRSLRLLPPRPLVCRGRGRDLPGMVVVAKGTPHQGGQRPSIRWFAIRRHTKDGEYHPHTVGDTRSGHSYSAWVFLEDTSHTTSIALTVPHWHWWWWWVARADHHHSSHFPLPSWKKKKAGGDSHWRPLPTSSHFPLRGMHHPHRLPPLLLLAPVSLYASGSLPPCLPLLWTEERRWGSEKKKTPPAEEDEGSTADK